MEHVKNRLQQPHVHDSAEEDYKHIGNDSDWSGSACCRYHIAVATWTAGTLSFFSFSGQLSRSDLS